jgi:hypothetical protein
VSKDLRKSIGVGLPAGWFMKAWSFEAPADAAGPDMELWCKPSWRRRLADLRGHERHRTRHRSRHLLNIPPNQAAVISSISIPHLYQTCDPIMTSKYRNPNRYPRRYLRLALDAPLCKEIRLFTATYSSPFIHAPEE